MANVSPNVPTLVDWAKRQDTNNKTARIIEMLSQSNMMIQDMPMVEGNLPTGHRTTVRTALPTIGRRQLNQGVTPSKSTTKQSDEQAAKFEAWAEVDCALARLNNDEAAFRLSEAKSFIEGMNQAVQQSLIYGNPGTDQTNLLGLAPRFASTTGPTGNNILLATGSPSGSDQTSIWLIGWGENSVHGFYPKGSTVGLEHKDLGEETAETTAGLGQTRMRVYRDQFIWDIGLAVRDWRFVVRAANIDTSALVAQSGNADLVTVMSRMIDRLPNTTSVKPVFYMNRTPQSWLRVQALSKSNNALAIEPALNQFGQRIGDLSFMGIPIRTVDQILNTESIIS